MTDKSAAEIEREIEEERHALARSLEALQETFSPDRLMNNATGYLRDNGGEFADRLVTQVKENPLAATVAGVGLAWLLYGTSRTRPAPVYDRSQYTHDQRFVRDGSRGRDWQDPDYRGTSPAFDDRRYPDAPGRLSSDPYPAGYDARLRAASGEDEPSTWDKARDKASDLAQDAREGAAHARDRVAGAAGSAYDATRSGAATGAAATRSGLHDAREGAAENWNAASGLASDGVDGARNRWSDMTGTASDRWGAMRDSTSGAFREWQDEARTRYDTAKLRARTARGRLYARSSSLRARLAEGTEGMTDAARARVMRARQTAAEYQREMEDRFGEYTASGRRMFDEQPLLGGLIAAGIGAIIGAALPRTRTEDEYIGAYRDRAFDEADRVFREEAAKLQAVANAALDEAKTVADEKLEGARSAYADAKDKAPSGDEAVERAESEAKGAAQRVADAAREEAERQNLGGSAKAEAEKAKDAAKSGTTTH